MASPGSSQLPLLEPKQRAASMQLSSRLKNCWEKEFDWNLLPSRLTEVK